MKEVSIVFPIFTRELMKRTYTRCLGAEPDEPAGREVN